MILPSLAAGAVAAAVPKYTAQVLAGSCAWVAVAAHPLSDPSTIVSLTLTVLETASALRSVAYAAWS